ncbi:MAG: hypothetical protein Q7S42_01360 [Candidatus Omnitrophota bacterium]|nr:hypothetical protein [Candidatus Omnitrophota bacterium]
MKLEEAIKILSSSNIQIISDFADKEYCGEALNLALEVLGRISDDKLYNTFRDTCAKKECDNTCPVYKNNNK